MGCLVAARAYEMLHDPELGPRIDMEGTLKLALRAGYSQPEAQEMARLQGLERMRRDEPA